MVKRWLLPGTMLVAAFLLAVGFVIGPRVVTAQDMSASPSPEADAHPAHIHTGTCAALGEVVYPLTDVAPVDETRPEMGGMMGSPAAESTESAEQMADATPSNVMAMMGAEESTTEVQTTLDELLASEHAINVHESMENIGNYIACGEITGTPTDGELEIQLNELNDSGYSGTATLKDNGDGTVTVTIYLMEAEGVTAEGIATPTS